MSIALKALLNLTNYFANKQTDKVHNYLLLNYNKKFCFMKFSKNSIFYYFTFDRTVVDTVYALQDRVKELEQVCIIKDNVKINIYTTTKNILHCFIGLRSGLQFNEHRIN